MNLEFFLKKYLIKIKKIDLEQRMELHFGNKESQVPTIYIFFTNFVYFPIQFCRGRIKDFIDVNW